MNVSTKNLFIFALLYTQIQALPVFADGISANNKDLACLADSVACKSVITVLNSIDDNNKQVINHANISFFDFQTLTKKEIYNEAVLVKSKADCGAGAKNNIIPSNQMMLNLGVTSLFKNTFIANENTKITASKNIIDYDAISQSDVQSCMVDVVPVPTAGWLFASALIVFITFSNRRRA
jgi:hypothetical protein